MAARSPPPLQSTASISEPQGRCFGASLYGGYFGDLGIVAVLLQHMVHLQAQSTQISRALTACDIAPSPRSLATLEKTVGVCMHSEGMSARQLPFLC